MTRIRPSIAVIVFLLLFLPVGLQAINRVYVRAEAMEEYLTERALDESKQIQTYQIMKGKYRAGGSMDPGMDKVNFEEIAYGLAIQLRKQNFYPTQEAGEGDLLIVVHYGATYSPDLFYNYGDPNSPFGMDVQQIISANMLDDLDTQFKAKLLGMEGYKDYGRWSSERRLLDHMVREGRYYIVLLAYDWRQLQSGEVVLLWRTRYSIRSLGQSYETAVQDMNRIASDYIGKNMQGLINKRVDDTSHVSFGEIEVINEEKIKEEDRGKKFLIFGPTDRTKELLELEQN